MKSLNNMLLWFVLPCVTLVAGAAQSMAELLAATPQCALPCVFEGAQSASCSLTDIKSLDDCVCSNITLQSSLSACVQRSCPFDDQVEAALLLSDLCVAYPKESRSNEVKITAVVCIVITTVIVILRSLARLTVTSRLWWDDWMILLATALLIAMSSIKIASADLGFGMHYWNVAPQNAPTILQNFYATQMLYILIQVTAKVSIVILFSRIFTTRWFVIVVWTYVVFLVVHGLLFLLLIVFQCIPIYAIWDKSISAKCLDITAIGWAGAVFSIVEDIAILVLPIPELLKLQLSFRKKIAVFLMFSVGSFACVTSMVRLKYMVTFANSMDATWDNVDIVVWSIIEVACAIVCGSLPALRPLLSKLPGIFSTTNTENNEATEPEGAGSRGTVDVVSKRISAPFTQRPFQQLPGSPWEPQSSGEDKDKVLSPIRVNISTSEGGYPDRNEDVELGILAKEKSTL